jgi:hypothetical protein
MAAEYSRAGVDGLILTYEDDLPNAFLRKRDVLQVLIES